MAGVGALPCSVLLRAAFSLAVVASSIHTAAPASVARQTSGVKPPSPYLQGHDEVGSLGRQEGARGAVDRRSDHGLHDVYYTEDMLIASQPCEGRHRACVRCASQQTRGKPNVQPVQHTPTSACHQRHTPYPIRLAVVHGSTAYRSPVPWLSCMAVQHTAHSQPCPVTQSCCLFWVPDSVFPNAGEVPAGKCTAMKVPPMNSVLRDNRVTNRCVVSCTRDAHFLLNRTLLQVCSNRIDRECR